MNLDVKKVVKKLSKLEHTLKNKIESGVLYNEVRRFASTQAKILGQKAKSSKDLKKLAGLIESRRKQIEKVAKDLPKEVTQVRSFIKSQRKELEKIGNDLLKQAKQGTLSADSFRSAIKKVTKKATSAKAAPRAKSAKKATKKRAR